MNTEKQTWYWKKRVAFSIGNGANIQPLEMRRKCPKRAEDYGDTKAAYQYILSWSQVWSDVIGSIFYISVIFHLFMT